jgi:hypothetical protein
MADEAKAPAPPRKKRARRRASEKPLSLYPLSLEEAVDKLLKVKPEPKATHARAPKTR